MSFQYPAQPQALVPKIGQAWKTFLPYIMDGLHGNTDSIHPMPTPQAAKPTANRTLHTTVQRSRLPSPSPASRMANTQLGTQAESAPPSKQPSTSKARKSKKAPRSPREQQAGSANPPTPTVRVTDEHLARGDTPDAVDTSAAQQKPLTIVASPATDKRVRHIRL